MFCRIFLYVCLFFRLFLQVFLIHCPCTWALSVCWVCLCLFSITLLLHFVWVPFENYYRKGNILKEIEILKAASSRYLLNDVINGLSDPVYRLIPSVSVWTPTIPNGKTFFHITPHEVHHGSSIIVAVFLFSSYRAVSTGKSSLANDYLLC